MNFRSTVSKGRARGENADVSEGGLQADGGAARRARPAERSPVDDQRQLSGAWRSERLREHARGDPTQRQVGEEGRLARERRLASSRSAERPLA